MSSMDLGNARIWENLVLDTQKKEMSGLLLNGPDNQQAIWEKGFPVYTRNQMLQRGTRTSTMAAYWWLLRFFPLR